MSIEFVKYTVKELKATSKGEFVQRVAEFTNYLNLKYNVSQEKSWEDCYEYLCAAFQQTTNYDDCILLFEYCLPFTNYRRPDVIMLFKGTVLVLEFKRKDVSLIQDVDQLRGYLNFMRRYHAQTSTMNMDVKGALILTTNLENRLQPCNGFHLLKGQALLPLLSVLNLSSTIEPTNVESWANSDYEPSKNVLKATYNMFIKDDLSMIKNISEHELKDILETLHHLTVQQHSKKRLVFLTGVPGAGKTLSLLHTLYRLNKEAFNAVFLTGNGPLQKVLSYLLTNEEKSSDGDALIKGVLAYKNTYYNRNTKKISNARIPATILFDEAQRAWNEEQMGSSFGMSEPELILNVQAVAAQQHGYTNVIASIGFGQSIYKGEEDEFATWVNVIEKPEYHDWEIYAPSTLKQMLGHLSNVQFIDELHLDTSIRSNFIDTSQFIEAVLAADVYKAREEYRKLREQGYYIHMVDNLQSAKQYLEANALDTGDNFYGLISSSNIHRENQRVHLGNAKMIKQTDTKETIGKWYFKNSSKLDAVATEFVCQGLELNIPILYFTGDFLMENGQWNVCPIKHYQNPEQTIRNIYRVLLSRGRIGTLLYIPPQDKYLFTKEFFKSIRIESIQ